MARCVNALKAWTGKTRATVIYDSTVDEFTDECLFQIVKGKKNIALVGFTTYGDVFGGFYSVGVTEQDEYFYDRSIFLFSFKSHGRSMTPQRFVVKNGLMEKHGGPRVRFFKDDSFRWFLVFWSDPGFLYLGNEKSRTWCDHLSGGFEGIEDTTLTGKNWGRFICSRLVAIQLE